MGEVSDSVDPGANRPPEAHAARGAKLKILVVASLTRSLVNFRRSLLQELVDSGPHDVIAAAPEADAETIEELSKMGVAFRVAPMARASTNPFADLRTLLALVSLYRRERPDIVLAYTQKPIIYGGLAARLFPRLRYFAMQSGLGYAFSEENKSGWFRRAVALLYRFGIKRAEAVFVFNSDDERDMRAFGILHDGQKVVQVPGSGIDLDRFQEKPLPSGAPVFLLVARLMKDKGLYEYIEAARRLRAEGLEARFQLLGPTDANPAAISSAELDAIQREGVVDYLGETKDVRPFLAASSVFVLPSFHREGLPRSILEAMSTGRAIVTTTMPGCRETVVEGENGFLVPPRDSVAVADAMRRFIVEPSLIRSMGASSRALAERKFSVRLVNDEILRTMHLRGAPAPPNPRPDGILRRALDVAAALILAVVTAPVLILLAAIVYATMGGPVFFRQDRAGRGGKAFRLVKFRTMTDARDAAGRLLPDAERITALGRFLRRSRLDELPELYNILAGEMSFVGPRPLLPTSPPNLGVRGRERLSIRPGLTGWAQISGNTLLDDEQKLALDLWYVRNRSLALDFRILIETAIVVLFGERIHKTRLARE